MEDLIKRIKQLNQERYEAHETLLRVDIEFDNLIKGLLKTRVIEDNQ